MFSPIVLSRLKGLLKSLQEQAELLREDPRLLPQLLEPLSQRVSRGTLSYASGGMSPVLLGSGVRVQSLGDLTVECFLPFRWKNTSTEGDWSRALLLATAEFMVSLLWQRHVERRRAQWSIRHVILSCEDLGRGDLTGRLRIGAHEREEALFSLRRGEDVETEHQILFFAHGDQRVAEVSLSLRISSSEAPALPSRGSPL